MRLSGMSDSSDGVAATSCSTCGAAAQVEHGRCLGCLLRFGFDSSSRAGPKAQSRDLAELSENFSNETWHNLLDQVELRDTNWRLGNYQILEEIGRGGMGVIYRARQRHSRRIVALKRVLSYHGDSRDTLERFRREAEAAASVDHPNILPIYEVGEADGLPFFTMKFATGGSLEQAGSALRDDIRECVRLVMKTTHAVAYAHGKGILHRDLKPGNILLDASGEPLVSDFGLAKWLDGAVDLTRTITVFGTPGYIAPEQAHSSANELTPAADIYSLGAILFNLLAGRPPFLGDHALAVIKQACEKPAPKLRSLVTTADRDLETICEHCLDRDPAARYPSAQDLAEDLERWLEGLPVAARVISPMGRLWRWTRRNPFVTAGSAIVGIALMIATIVSLHERKVAIGRNQELARTLQDASRADAEAARQRLNKGAWREGLAFLARSLSFSSTNRDSANYLLSALAFGRGDRDKLPIFGVYHNAAIIEAAFSADGKYFATASYDHTTRVWDAQSGNPIAKTFEHAAPCCRPCFGPEGRRFISSGEDGVAKLWDIRTGELQCILRHGRPEVDSLSHVVSCVFSYDGRQILTGSFDHTARVWDVASKTEVARLANPQRVAHAIWSPDGSRILTSYWYGGAQLWDARTYRPIGEPMTHSATVRKSLFTPDGSRVVTSSLDHTARIWDGHTGKPLTPPMKHSDFIWDLDISPNGKFLATASYDKTVKLWSTEDGSAVGIPLLHEGPVDTVAFSPEGKQLVTASRDRTVRLWDTATCREVETPMRHDQAVLGATFNPVVPNRVLSIGSEGAAYLWNTRQKPWPGEILPFFGKVCSVDFANSEDQLFVATREGKAGIWSLTKKGFSHPIIEHGDTIIAATYHPATKLGATIGSSGVIRFWNMEEGKQLGLAHAGQDTIVSAAFSADATSIFVAHLDGFVQRWRVPEGTPIGERLRHSEKMDALASSPSSDAIATGCRDDFLYLWKPSNPALGPSKIRQSNPVCALTYSPDGKFIAAGSNDNTVRVWEVASGRQVAEPFFLDYRPTTLRYSGDGTSLLIGGSDNNEVDCYDVGSHDNIFLSLPHAAGISQIASSVSGSSVITLTNDGVARLWRIPKTTEAPPKWLPEYLRALGGLTFSPQQQLVQVSTRERLELRKKLLAQQPENTIWDKVMRWSFQQEPGPAPVP